MTRNRQHAFYWSILCAVGTLCCVLAILQYRWTGDLARAERARLRNSMQAALTTLSRDFNLTITDARSQLQPTPEEVAPQGRQQAYAARYARWQESSSNSQLFQHVGIAIPQNGTVELKLLSVSTHSFTTAAWPRCGRSYVMRSLLECAEANPQGSRMSHSYVKFRGSGARRNHGVRLSRTGSS
jgi:hypothetical protein